MVAERRVFPGQDIVYSDGWPVVLLDDGTIGYCADPTRKDDCLRPAIATALGVHIRDVPDPRIDERLEAGVDPEVISSEFSDRLERWLDGRGLRLIIHHPAPDRERWVGVFDPAVVTVDGRVLDLSSTWPEQPPFMDHCLVMRYDQIIHDPARSLTPPRGTRPPNWNPRECAFGITFDPKEQ
jgi:hypothetical protein